jgi:hypothetical protein
MGVQVIDPAMLPDTFGVGKAMSRRAHREIVQARVCGEFFMRQSSATILDARIARVLS